MRLSGTQVQGRRLARKGEIGVEGWCGRAGRGLGGMSESWNLESEGERWKGGAKLKARLPSTT